MATLNSGKPPRYKVSLLTYLLHGEDGPGDELPVVPDREVPGADAHHVVERELDDQPTLRVHLKAKERTDNSQAQGRRGASYSMSKKSKDRLCDSALYLTMRDHATYPSTFLTYL